MLVDKKNIKLTSVLLILNLYVFLKIYRNSINYGSTEQGGFWNYLLLALLFFGALSIFPISLDRFSQSIRTAIIYLVTVWINGLLTFSISGISGIYYYIVAPCYVLIMVLSYKLFLSSDMDAFSMRIWNLCWVAIFAILFYTFVKFFGQFKYYENSGRIALNNSYYAACVIPFFLRKKTKFNLGMVFFAILIVFISNKRTGLIAVALSLVVYYLVSAKLLGSFSNAIKRTMIGIIVVIIGFFAFSYIDSKYSLDIFSRLMKLFDDGGSGRVVIYNYVWSEINSASFFQFLFGHGVSSITHMPGMSLSSAHCDFLNIFYEYGLTAVLCILAFYYSLLSTLRKMVKMAYPHSASFSFSIIISLFFSMFSANLDNQSFSLVLALYWGMEIARWKKWAITGMDEGTKTYE